MFSLLVEYREAHGDCDVPRNRSENPKLATWVGKQRDKRETLSEDHIRRLDELGFVWNPREVAWEGMFALLVEYKEAHGDCNVPREWPKNPKLARWVTKQRHERVKETLSEDRIRRLDELGFVWDLEDARWEEMFAVLVKFREVHGDCNVPAKWPENPQLGGWLSRQRAMRMKGTLSEDRIRRLDELGFVWNPLEVPHKTRKRIIYTCAAGIN